jgi:hypothetical protein
MSNCRDCGATVTASDRWCAACGTPNAACRLHPRFGPEVNRFEPEILFDTAPEGAPSCPRCERALTPGRWCRACGMDLAATRARHQREQAVEAWRRQGPPPPFAPAGGLGRALRADLTVTATVLLALAAALVAEAAGLVVAGPVVTGALAVVAALTVVAAVLGLAWARRARRNVAALAVADHTARRWAALAWLVPVLNLVLPKLALDDLWRTGDPDLPVCSDGWRRVEAPALSALWWAMGLVGALLAGTAALGAAEAVPGTAAAMSLLGAVAAAVVAGSVLALHALVVGIDRRQTARRAAVDEALAPATIELPADYVPTRLEPLEPAPAAPSGRRTSALSFQPSTRRPVWGRY